MPLSTRGRPGEEVALRVLHASLDEGVTLIDTADVYCLDDRDIGHNERLIAKALAAWPGRRDSIVVATKGGLTRPAGRWEQDGRPEHLRAACERSLVALGVERIDLYQLHAPDPSVPFHDSVGALADLQKEGKVRWVGLSNVSVAQIQEAESIVPIQTVQNRLSPFFREALERGVVDYCGERGIGFVAYSPVGGGRLHRKLPKHAVVGKIARARECSPHSVVLAWVLAQSPVLVVIPGARTVEHARDSARVPSLELSAADLEAITAAAFSRA